MARPLGLGTLRILAAIRDGATYGLDIVSHTGLPSGTVYPTLGRLKKRSLVRARWEEAAEAEREGRPRRKYYELSAEGARVLSREAGRVQALAAALDPDTAPDAG